MPKLLVIDDDRSVRHIIEQSLRDQFEVLGAATAEEGLARLAASRPDLVLLDVFLPETSGLAVLERIQEFDRRLPVIFITVGGTSDDAIDAMMRGAYDYLLKPLDIAKLRDLAAKALRTRQLVEEPVKIPSLEEAAAGEALVGRSPKMLAVYKAIARVAPQDVTVLIRGESGTGKELVARAIYQHSTRRDRQFLAVNCAAMTETLLESELFGHEKGAFTGADRRRIGKFEQCHGGTILLDEVGDMSPLVQAKVLRILQEKTFERVGGNETLTADVRIISATNRDLEALATEGRFRSDLFFRLNGFAIDLPPLRERGDDLLLLLEHFLSRFRRELGKTSVEGIAASAVEPFLSYSWPGNVREMQSTVRQALLNATGPVIVADCLPETLLGSKLNRERASPDDGDGGLDLPTYVESRLRARSRALYSEAIEQLERYLLVRVLQETKGNQSQAAQILGITRGKVRDRIGAYGIRRDVAVEAQAQGATE